MKEIVIEVIVVVLLFTNLAEVENLAHNQLRDILKFEYFYVH